MGRIALVQLGGGKKQGHAAHRTRVLGAVSPCHQSNAELRLRWSQISLKNNFEPGLSSVRDFLLSTGKQKFNRKSIESIPSLPPFAFVPPRPDTAAPRGSPLTPTRSRLVVPLYRLGAQSSEADTRAFMKETFAQARPQLHENVAHRVDRIFSETAAAGSE